MKETERYRATMLSEILKNQGRHQRWLSQRLGVHESYLSRVISGEKSLSRDQAELAAGLLQVPLLLAFELLQGSKTHLSSASDTQADRIPA